ncbi:hypothetical protein BON22_2545 [Cyberlindnera fabianii]|uniref:5'-3' exoribonuclease 1 n=1 Tax=Cyberlindnera fabianii TaxID=36022 RepID=A0A1V2L963_CYBFA|nr:hypothetical protein BON22_2545 [Cyberlindnera fabianii]
MGIPKFFRFISERWPMISQLIDGNQIPEFDTLYLDMNSILHTCTRPKDEDVTKRLSEEEVFSAIFAYIDHLFDTIKPKKVFYMAIDGVAPRAKMNQQRARRFRTALDAEKNMKKAIELGQELPEQEPFDSNSITPGTEFMHKLTRYLKYFIHKKVSTDSKWQDCEIILSGHEVPGEGEHKIMEFIRNKKALPDYDPNTRHCVYGLDADLIMLGLVSHDPHFALLREEVTFGRRSTQPKSVEEQKFYLLHISLVREYLELEFQDLKEQMSFEYDFERVLDDFILIMYVIGNDFLPNLPDLHLNKGAFPLLLETFKEALRGVDGYINEYGTINLKRLADSAEQNLDFLKDFAYDADLVLTHSKGTGAYSVRIDIDGIDLTESEEDWADRVSNIRRVVKKYEAAIILDAEGEGAVEEKKQIYNEKFENWKDNYYKDKLGFSIKDEEALKEMTENYIEGLQWVLYYYYNGVKSWPWYYRYHYAPRISDIKKGLGIMINLEMGQPFKPFEQLMAVLPARSAKLVPAPYRALMTDEHSPIRDFYPDDVETDLNGKTADWEAVVKLSFVDQQRLQDALRPLDKQLTPEEKYRNSFGRDLLFTFNPQINEVYKSPLPGVFGDIETNRCFETVYDLKIVDSDQLVKGLCKGVKLGADSRAGFPTLKTIPFKNELKPAGVVIFNFPSKSTSVVLKPEDSYEGLEVEQFAKRYVNKIVWTRYPYLRESKVVRVTDGHFEYYPVKSGAGYKVVSRPVDPEDAKTYKQNVGGVIRNYVLKKGIELKGVRALVTVKAVSGLKRTSNGAYVKDYTDDEEIYPLSLVIDDVKNKDERYFEKPPLPINEEFPMGSKIIFLGDYAYGGEAEVNGYATTTRLNLSVTKMSVKAEPQFGQVSASKEARENRYYPSFEVARNLKIHPLFLSKITSSYMIDNGKNQRINIGLDLKFDSRREKVVGYTRKSDRTWEFSALAINLIQEYRKKFHSFFSYLSNKNVGPGQMITLAEILPALDAKQSQEKLSELTSWLKEVKSKLNRTTLESDFLTSKSIKDIEDQIEVFVAQADKHDVKKLVGVPREAVLDPSVSFNKLKAQAFKLGDRIVYVHDSGKVPLFSKGTVIGYHSVGAHVTLQVLFDKPLLGGNRLGGQLRTNRALDVDSSLVLNITNQQFIFHSKASAQKKKPKAAPRAPAPAPAIHGSTASKKSAVNTSAPATAAKKTPAAPKPNGTPKKPELLKKPKDEKPNELLSLLKGGKKSEKTDQPEDSTVTPPSKNHENAHDASKAFKLMSIQNFIVSDMHGSSAPQPMMFPPPPGMMPPQGFPGGFPPQGFPPQGFPPQGFPPQGFPPQGIPTQGNPASAPSQAPAQNSSGGVETNGNHQKKSNTSGRGRGRGGARGGFRGRGKQNKPAANSEQKKSE